MEAEDKKVISNVTIRIDGKDSFSGDDGADYSLKNGANIFGMRVEKQLMAPNAFSAKLVISDGTGGTGLVFVDQAVEGKAIEILIGYGADKSEVLFKGEISYIEPNFDFDGTSYLELAGYDKSHRLTRGSVSKTWGDGFAATEKADVVAKQVIGDSGYAKGTGADSLSAGSGEASPVKVPYLALYNTNLFQFSRQLGFDVNAEDRDQEKTISFAKIEPGKRAALKVCRERSEGADSVVTRRARFHLSTVRQYKKVVVRGWDPKEKKAIIGVSEESTHQFDGTPSHSATGKALYGSGGQGKEHVVVDQPVQSKDEAEAMAKALFDKFSMDFVTGEIEIVGDPRVEPGETVDLAGFGKRFSGTYLISGCTHSYYPDGDGYITTMSVSRNSIKE
jgi:uncharacterized protein